MATLIPYDRYTELLDTRPSLSAGLNAATKTIGLTFPTQTGPTYALQYKNSLVNSNWQVWTNVSGTGRLLQLTIPTATAPMMYFRLLVH